MVDLLSGQIPALFATLSTVVPHMNSGSIKVLGLIEAKRSRTPSRDPDHRRERAGLCDAVELDGFLCSRRVARADRVAPPCRAGACHHGAVPVRALLDQNGFEIGTSEKGEFGAEVQKSLERFGKIATEAGITPQQ